jgi:Relaxase/Mobilisation nuclease domain
MTDALKDLADNLAHLLESEVRPRKSRSTPIWRIGAASKTISTSGPAVGPGRRLHILKQALSRAPEVIVKITGTNKEVPPLKAHLDYLRRKPGAVVEDERGDQLEATGETVKQVLRTWGVAVEEGRDNASTRRDRLRNGHDPAAHDSRATIAVHIVLSMPAGTNAALVMDAVRGFASEELANHQHLLVLHQDRDHPHVHIVVNNVGNDLRRLPRKRADLQRWREVFAEQLRERGIDAAATPRRARGVLNKGESLAYVKLKERIAGERAQALAEGRTYEPKAPVRALRASAKRAIEEARGIRAVEATKAEQERQLLVEAMQAEAAKGIEEAVRGVIESFAAAAEARKSRSEELRDLAALREPTVQPVNVADAHDLDKRRGPER